MRPVIILWDDAYSEDEWTNLDNYNCKPETPNISIGYIVHYNNDYVHLASTIDQDGNNCCGIMAIPYSMIVYVAPLQILNEAKMYGDKEELEQYLQGKFAQRPEVYDFNDDGSKLITEILSAKTTNEVNEAFTKFESGGISSKTTHEPSTSNQPIQD